MSEISEAIKTLGDTEEKISQTLREKGIKGTRGELDSCPVAIYLTEKLGKKIRVGAYSAWAEDNPNESNVDLPEWVSEWVKYFDREEYPEFDKYADWA